MILVVLASGRGKRLGPLTKKTPKCLIEVFKKKTLLDLLAVSFKLFNQIIITTGYKSEMIKKKIKLKKVKFVKNKNYHTTNMVESLMKIDGVVKKHEDIIITYSDIYFDHKVFSRLKKIKGNCLVLNKNWQKLWIKRFKTNKNIIKDAEDLRTKNKMVFSIGGKITDKLPKLQYTGILKIDSKSFDIFLKFYKALKNKNISMTEFINQLIEKKVTNFKYITMSSFWYEIDNKKDLELLKEDILHTK